MRNKGRTIYVPTLEQVEQERSRLLYQKISRGIMARLILSLIIIMGLAVWFMSSYFSVFRITDSSTWSVFSGGELLLLNKKSTFSMGDYCVRREGEIFYPELVIAAPGDLVTADGTGEIFVNGLALEGDYFKNVLYEGEHVFSLFLPENGYLVLRVKEDAEEKKQGVTFAFVEKGQLEGKILTVLWPFKSIGIVDSKMEVSAIKEQTVSVEGAAEIASPMIQILKYDRDNVFRHLSGASFAMVEGEMEDGIFHASDPKRIWTGQTGADGILTFGASKDQPLKTGMVYQIRETAAPSGYFYEAAPRYLLAEHENCVLSCEIPGSEKKVLHGQNTQTAEKLPLSVTVPAAALPMVLVLLLIKGIRYRRRVKR